MELNLLPQALNLALYAGDGMALTLSITDPAGLAIPVTGSVEAQIRTARIDVAPTTTFTVDLADSADGKVTLSLTGTQTAGLVGAGDRFTGVWDCEWTQTASEPLTLVQGNVSCALDVTR